MFNHGINKNQKPHNLIQTIERVSLILDILGEYPQGISVKELSAKVELPKGTTHCLLSSLVYFDFVSQDELTKNYHLGFTKGSRLRHGTEYFQKMIRVAAKAFPNLKVIGTTLRTVKSASINDWGAICWTGGQFYEAPLRENLEIFDRVGGGDSFASGLIYGFMTTGDPQTAVNYGAAHGALAMTTPGDTSMATVKEVEKIMVGGGARVVR
jgi:hypothetical protein